MRNALIYCLIGFYFLISIRITANFHFCKKRLVSCSLVGFSEDKSCCKGKKVKGKCCENIKISLKKINSDKPSSSVTTPNLATLVITQPIDIKPNEEPTIYIPREINQTTNDPPAGVFPAINIKNCVFII